MTDRVDASALHEFNRRVAVIADAGLILLHQKVREKFSDEITDILMRKIVVKMFSMVYQKSTAVQRLDMLSGLSSGVERFEQDNRRGARGHKSDAP